MPIDERDYQRHPAYGQAVFTRVSSTGTKLYASHLKRHNEFITLRIYRSQLAHSLGQDWRHTGKELIEVAFSSAQFAQLLTTMNIGEGAPCTIMRLTGHNPVPDIPEEDATESERVKGYFNDSIAKFRNRVRELVSRVDNLFKERKGKSIRKADMERINFLLLKLQQAVDGNWGFVIDQFQRSTDKVETAAKAEIEALITMAVEKLGVKSLQTLRDVSEEKMLPVYESICQTCGASPMTSRCPTKCDENH